MFLSWSLPNSRLTFNSHRVELAEACTLTPCRDNPDDQLTIPTVDKTIATAAVVPQEAVPLARTTLAPAAVELKSNLLEVSAAVTRMEAPATLETTTEAVETTLEAAVTTLEAVVGVLVAV
jgi:hypothetical protein